MAPSYRYYISYCKSLLNNSIIHAASHTISKYVRTIVYCLHISLPAAPHSFSSWLCDDSGWLRSAARAWHKRNK